MSKRLQTIEFVVLAYLSLVCVLLWLRTLGLTPDSTNYIAAAMNLVAHGRLETFVNWPSMTLGPVMEPFTEYPPGMPLLLAPWIAIVHDPVVAAAIFQSISIVALFAAVAWIARVLDFAFPFRLLALLTAATAGTFLYLYSNFWTETLFVALSLGTAAGALTLLRQPRNERRWWIVTCVLIFASCGIKFVGLANLAWLVPLAGSRRRRAMLPLAAAAASAIVPIGAWLLRNQLLYGYPLIVTRTKSGAPWARFTEPYHYLANGPFDLRFVPSVLVLLLWLGVVLLPLYMKGRPRAPHATVLIGVAAFFGGMWFLALLSRFNRLDDRLFAMAVVAGAIAALNGFNMIYRRGPSIPVRMATIVVPLLFLVLSVHTRFTHLRPEKPRLHYPIERELWREIDANDRLRTASHFYSDYVFTHQIFAGKPQCVLWKELDHDVRNLIFREKAFALGEHPFFVFSADTEERKVMDFFNRQPNQHIERVDFEELGYVVYYQSAPRDDGMTPEAIRQ